MAAVEAVDPSGFVTPTADTKGISRMGTEAERRFKEITGADAADKNSAGDAKLQGHHIEVKWASNTTINQVRAVKYITLVVLDSSDAWYVIPPNEVVREVSKKKRGQHTENPFECATLSLNKFRHFQVHEDELRSKTLDAIEQGNARPRLKRAMAQIKDECEGLARKSRQLVSQAMDD